MAAQTCDMLLVKMLKFDFHIHYLVIFIYSGGFIWAMKSAGGWPVAALVHWLLQVWLKAVQKNWGEWSDVNLHIMINIRDCQKQLYSGIIL